ncbi:MAG: hypothetical protein WAW86_00205 [Gammaproteobacteria bacterium]
MSLTRSGESNQINQAQQELELFGGGATQAIEDGPFAWDDAAEPTTPLRTQSLFSSESSIRHTTGAAPTLNLRRSW